MRLKTWAVGLSVVTMALLSACGGGSDKAKVRLLNASIGYSSLDMVAGDDENTINSAVAYGSVGDYGNVDPDDAGIEIQNSTNGATLVSTTPSLTTKVKYTVIAYGVSGSMKTTLLTESQDTPDSGKSKLQVLNLSADAGSLDVYETSTSETTLDDAATFASSIASGSGSGYISTKSGTYRLVITAAGDTSDVRLEIPSITLPSKGVSTLVLTGSNGGVLVNGMQLIQKGAVTNYANTAARVRVVSGLVGNTVAATLDSTTIQAAVASPNIGSYTQVTAGSPTLSMTVDGTAITVSSPTLVAGYDYTLLLYGDSSSPTLTVITDDNKLPTTSTYAKIRLLNGVTNNTAGQTLYVDYSAKASSITPGAASTSVQLAASTDSLITVNTTTASSALFTKDDTTITAQGVYTVFMLGDGTSSSTVNGSLVKER